MRLTRLTVVAMVLALTIVTAAAGCGGADATRVQSKPQPTSTPVVGADLNIPLAVRYDAPRVLRDGRAGFRAALTPVGSSGRSRPPADVRMTGLGFPGAGVQDGRRYVGPGVDKHYTLQNNEYDVSFQFTGTRVGLLVFSTGGAWRALVDGGLVGGTAPRPTGNPYSYHSLDLDFSRSGGARRRTVTFELSGGAWLAGLYLGAGSDRVSLPPPPRVAAPSVYWLGDSYVVGSGAQYSGFNDLVHVASQRAGLSDVTVDALGGTGYVKSNGGAKFPNYLTRARMNLGADRARPDLIIVGGSINDAGYTEQQVQAGASALYAYVARALPKAKIIVVPFTDYYPVPSGVQSEIDGVLAAARSAPNVIGTLNLPARVLAQRGGLSEPRLSARLASTTVEAHPSPAAHRLYGEMIGAFIASLLQQGKVGAN